MPLGILNNLSLVNRDHYLASGLVSWYLALPHYAGTNNWPDIGLAANLGAISGAGSGTGWATSTRPGGFGCAMKFDGTATIVDCTALVLPSGTTPMSFAFWCRSDNLTGFRTPYFYGNSAAGRGVLFAQDGTSNDGTIDVGIVGTNIISSTNKLVVNTWAHVALTYDGTTARLYFNGLADNTAVAVLNPPEIWSRIGSYIGSQFWQGSVDDVRIYWRQLSASEVKGLYTNSLEGCPGLLNFVDPHMMSVPVPASTQAVPGFTQGPPMRSPWLRVTALPPPSVPLQAAPAVGSNQAVPGVTYGPPMHGAPWFKVVPLTQHVQKAAPAIVGLPVLPGFTMGPPMLGAPWVRPAPTGYQISQATPIVPTVSSPLPGFTVGPPMVGAPWFKPALAGSGLPSVPAGFVPPTPPVTTSNIKPFLARDPRAGGDSLDPRLRRITEVVSSIVNSLVGQGQLVQTGPEAWKLNASSSSGSGLSGSYP